MAENKIIRDITDPRVAQQALVEKERGDVTGTLNSIEHAMEDILDKREKLEQATDTQLSKMYKAHIKDQNNHLKSLFKTLNLEMIESVSANYILERMTKDEKN
jgi:predicted  nucleic acid-binding Zn-ribbon protein